LTQFVVKLARSTLLVGLGNGVGAIVTMGVGNIVGDDSFLGVFAGEQLAINILASNIKKCNNLYGVFINFLPS
jgi:hypothetical protein